MGTRRARAQQHRTDRRRYFADCVCGRLRRVRVKYALASGVVLSTALLHANRTIYRRKLRVDTAAVAVVFGAPRSGGRHYLVDGDCGG